MKKACALFLAMIMMLSMAVSASATDLGDLFGGFTEILGKEETEVYGVGETAEINGIAVTFDRVLESSGSSDSYLPQDGNVFLVCEFTIENKTEEAIVVSTLMCFNMNCDDKLCELSSEALAVSLSAGKLQLDRAIEPGAKETGVVGYEVPAEWKNFELKFTPDPYFNSGEYLVFSPYTEPAEDEKEE